MEKVELQKLNPNELIQLSEKDTSDFRWNRSDIYKTAFDKYKQKGKKKELDDMRKEILIFDLSTHNYPKQRFDCMIGGTSDKGEEWKYPNIEKDFPDEAIEYYRKRAAITKNPILKARYCDVIWELKKEVKYARLAIDSYLNCCTVYFDNVWDKELSDSLDRALSIASMMNDEGLIDKSLNMHQTFIKKLVKIKRFRYLIDIMESIIRQKKKLKEKINHKYLLSFIEEAISDYKKNSPNSFHIQREFVEIIAEIWLILKNKVEWKKAKTRIAESYVDEAEWKKVNYPTSNMVAAIFYKRAMKVYMDLGGFNDKIKELKLEIAKANKKASETEFKRIESRVNIPMKHIADYLKRYKNRGPLEILQIMSIDMSLIPSYKKAKETAIELSKQFITQRLVPVSIIKGNITVKWISEEKDKLEYNAIRNFQIGYRLMAKTLLIEVFNMLEELHSTYIETFIEYLSSSEIIDDERLELIELGLEAYNEQKYVPAIHILVFQIEGILRDLLGKLGLPTFVYRNDEMRERLLSDTIVTLSKVEGVGKDFLKFIEIFLCDIRGDNIRNDLAHGLLTIDSFIKENAQLLLLILIKLAAFKIVKRKKSKREDKKVKK